MPYIETETAEPVTYTDSGPDGRNGCDEDNIRPPGQIAGTYDPIKKGDDPHWDDTIPSGYYVCFYDKKGDEKKAETNRGVSKYETVTLKEDYSTEITPADSLVEKLIEALGMRDVEEFLEKSSGT